MDKIFISHSTKDKTIVESFVAKILLLGIGLSEDNVFCSSSEGMNIKSGEDWRGRIKDELTQAKIILLMISPNYKDSEICLNEMGAAWITNAKVIPFALGKIDYKSVGLSRLCEEIRILFPKATKKFKVSIWDSKKRLFLRETEQYLAINPLPTVFSRNEAEEELKKYEQLKKDFDDLLISNEKMEQEIKALKECKDVEEVRIVENEYEDRNVLDAFENLRYNTMLALKNVSYAVVRTMIYNSRYDKHLDISHVFCKDIAAAEAKHFIEMQGDEYVPLYKREEMIDVRDSLNELEDFLSELDEKDRELLQDKYKITDIDNVDFWTEVLDVTMDYN